MLNDMEASEQKMKVWQRHPWLTLIGSCLINLLIVFLFACIDFQGWKDDFFNSNFGACLYFLEFLLVYSFFAFSLYLTGWCSDSCRKRFIFVLFGGLLLFIPCLIAMLFIALFGIGVLTHLIHLLM
jgi:biotin transporter BioY